MILSATALVVKHDERVAGAPMIRAQHVLRLAEASWIAPWVHEDLAQDLTNLKVSNPGTEEAFEDLAIVLPRNQRD